MQINIFRSDIIYQKIVSAPKDKQADIFRYELMKPFKVKWDCYGIPLKAEQPNGYDVVMACSMLGFLVPPEINSDTLTYIELLGQETLWNSCEDAIKRSVDAFTGAGIELPVKEYLYTILLANPQSPYTVMNEGYGGDGGIPGYIFGSIVPNEYTIGRLPVALAHEFNHNVRFQFEKWSNDITLGEMMISEGLAENFAVSLFGEDMVGPWVSKTSLEMLNNTIKPVIKNNLQVTGMDGITPYLYGDKMAELQGYFPVGLPYCAGYACGYHAVRYYLEKSKKTIVEATLVPTKEILFELKDFW